MKLDQWLHKSLGQTSISKHNFYSIFCPAWLESFTSENIRGSFAKAGIKLFKPLVVLNTIKRRPETPPELEDQPTKPVSTLLTSKSIRRAQKRYKENPTKENLDIIFCS